MPASGVAVEDGWIAVPGGRMFVRGWRPSSPQAPPLVLLHDWLGCVELALSAGFLQPQVAQ